MQTKTLKTIKVIVKPPWTQMNTQNSSSHLLGKHLHFIAAVIITCIRGWVLPFVGGCVFWDGEMCVCMGWVVSADISAGWEWEASHLILCFRAVLGWCCGDGGSILPSMCEVGGMRETGMGETKAFSMCKGERGETEGVGVRVCAGERKMWLREDEVDGWGAVQGWG